jgi:hypothetical protein
MKRFYHEPLQTDTNKRKVNFAVLAVMLSLVLAFAILAMACDGSFMERTVLEGTWEGGSGIFIFSGPIFKFYDAKNEIWYEGTFILYDNRITLIILRYSKDNVNYYGKDEFEEKYGSDDSDDLPTVLEGTYDTDGENLNLELTDDTGGDYVMDLENTTSPPPPTQPLPPVYPPSCTELTINIWTDGNIAASNGEQWFKFTATASAHYFHVAFSTLDDLYVQLYDDIGKTVGARTNLRSATRYTSRTVTSGVTYYIRVQPESGKSGNYKIAFNRSSVTPGTWTAPATATELSSGVWTSGNTTTSIKEQWFSFAATASPQYIHVTFGTLKDLYVQIYDSGGSPIGNAGNLRNSSRSLYRTVGVGELYYISVWPYSVSGNFQIAFNDSSTRP